MQVGDAHYQTTATCNCRRTLKDYSGRALVVETAVNMDCLGYSIVLCCRILQNQELVTAAKLHSRDEDVPDSNEHPLTSLHDEVYGCHYGCHSGIFYTP